MNRIQRVFSALGKSPIDDYFVRNKPKPELEGEAIDKVYEKSDLVYICVRTTAQAISQVPMQVGKKKNDKWAPLPSEHPWQKRIAAPSPYLSRYAFPEAIISYLLVDGESFIIPWPPRSLTPANSKEWVPAAFYVVPAAAMDPIKDMSTGQLAGWTYRPGGTFSGKGFPLELADVGHIFFWNPYDPVRGFAPIRAGKISIVTDYKAAKFNQLFFDRGATFTGVLETDQRLGTNQFDRLKEEINQYKGYKKAWDMFILEQGLKFHAITPSHKDMMFPDLRQLDKERVLQIFGMKKAVISVTDDLNFATAKEQRKSWWQDTNIPIMKNLLAALNFSFFEPQGLEIRFDLSTIEALQEDFKEKVATARNLWEMGYTANEINARLELGFEEIPHRSKPYITVQVVPIDELGKREDMPGEAAPPPPAAIEQPPPHGDMILLPAGGHALNSNKGEDRLLLEAAADKGAPQPGSLTFEVLGSKSWASINQKIAPIEDKFQKKVERAFFEWRVKVIEWLYKEEGKAVKGTDDPFVMTRPLTDLDELAIKPFRRLKQEADDLYRMSFMAGIETIAVEIGITYDAVDILAQADVISYLSEKVIRLVGRDGIQRAVSRRLNETIIDGIENNETVMQIAKRLKQQFRFAATRAKTIARTEVFSAMNAGRTKLMGEGDFTKRIWWTCLDERVRETHQQMHGRKEDMGKMWVLPSGAKMMYPGDSRGPAAEVINCRCIETVDLSSYHSPEE